MNEGCSYIWKAGNNPYMITSGEKVIMFSVTRDIPYLIKNSELCQPRDATDEDYRFHALPSIKENLVDDSVVAGEPSDGGREEPPTVPVLIEEGTGEAEENNPRRNLREEAMSLNHLLTHKPFNIYCDACNLGKMRKAKKFVGSYQASRQPTKWLDLVTADHLVAKNGGMEGITGDLDALVVKDLYSKVKVLLPVRSKTGEEATRVLMQFFGNHEVGRLYSDNAPELELACTTLGILQETSRAGVPQNNAVIERTNLDILEGTRTTLISAGFPECFWPFAAQHFCFLENTSIIGLDGKVYQDGSPYNHAHGQGEVNALRIPFGCAVYFYPADTKGFAKGKFEGSGEAGVIAGYNMSPGYIWDGEYLCWSLKELAEINMMAKAAKHPPGLQSPHVTKKVRLPSGNSCYFPLKEKYDRQFRSIDGINEILTEERQQCH